MRGNFHAHSPFLPALRSKWLLLWCVKIFSHTSFQVRQEASSVTLILGFVQPRGVAECKSWPHLAKGYEYVSGRGLRWLMWRGGGLGDFVSEQCSDALSVLPCGLNDGIKWTRAPQKTPLLLPSALPPPHPYDPDRVWCEACIAASWHTGGVLMLVAAVHSGVIRHPKAMLCAIADSLRQACWCRCLAKRTPPHPTPPQHPQPCSY